MKDNPIAKNPSAFLERFPGLLFQAEVGHGNELGIAFYCPDAERLLGIGAGALHQDAAAFFDGVPELETEALRRHLLDPGSPDTFEKVIPYNHPTAQLRWFLVQARRCAPPDAVPRWLGHLVDVTVLHEARLSLERTQTLLRAAQEQAGLGCWEFELATGKITWSPEVFRIHGWNQAQEPSWEDFQKLIVAEDFAKLQQAVEAAVAYGTPYRMDLRIIRADTGEVRYVAGSGGVLRNPLTGRIERLFGTAIDIHDRKVLEQTLAAARDAAESAARAKSDFLATMSHEIRTPLHGVIAATSLLRNLQPEGAARDYCEAIYRSSEALLMVVNDILDYSKIESGRLVLEQVPFSLEELVQTALTMVSPQLRAKGLSLLPELPTQPLPPVVGDPARIRQVLLNLLSNAIKFTLEGWLRVALRPLEQTPEALRFSVEVQDTGIGIPAEKIPLLFERFTQAESSSNRRFGGSGLGLAICKQLIEQMQGRIGARSIEREGSTFWFELMLPVHTGQWMTAADAQPVRPSRALRVLVAEDNVVNQRIALWVLESAGCQVTMVHNGLSAIQAADEPFDIILMDCQMPEMDGYEATRQIRARQREQHRPRIPIIGLTANAQPEDRRRCLAADMDDHIAKPYKPEELLAILARWTDSAVAAATAKGSPEPVALN